jgi:uncharacterized sulfatase
MVVGAPLSRRAFLGSNALAAPAFLQGAAGKRNVLFIATDDLSARLGCYGASAVKTPNLDRLAQSGVLFNNAYCQFPLCCPSRTSLMTGLAPDTTRIWGNNEHFRSTMPDAVTIPQAFQKNGYFVARAGKIYHYNNPSEIGTPGLDDPASWQVAVNPVGFERIRDEAQITYQAPRAAGVGRPNNGTMPGNGRSGAAQWLRGGLGPSGIRIAQDGRTPVIPMSQNGDLGIAIATNASASSDETHSDFMVAESIMAMMEEHRNEPWFLAAGLFKPHVPWILPSKYFDLYPAEGIEIPPFDSAELAMAPRWAYTTNPPNYGMMPQQHREAIQGYYAAISFVDAQVGRLVGAVQRLGLARDTTIVFWSDHGFNIGEHGQWQKMSLFEPSVRVPLIFAGAGVNAAPSGCRRTVENLDIYPTLVELCGLKSAPPGLQGRSLAPLLSDAKAAWDHPAISQVNRSADGKTVMGYSLRTERHRYTMWASGAEGEELYDYQSDPRESRNLAGDSGSAALKSQLRATLERIARSRGMGR